MDSIAPFIAWIKKNIFWLACALMSIAMIAMWYVSWASVGKLTEKDVKEIKGMVQATKTIQGKTAEGLPEDAEKAHPNATTEEGMKEELRASVDSIVAAWKKRVEDQNEILKWPSVIPNDRFERVFSQYNPPELIPDEWLKGDGELGSLLDLYKLKIPEHMTNICKAVGTRWNYDPEVIKAQEAAAAAAAAYGDDEDGGQFGGGGGPPDGARGGGGMGMGGQFGGPDADAEVVDMNQYPVVWHDTNQELWFNKLSYFKGKDDHVGATDSPTPLQCCMLQQDLWLLEAMFKIIKEVNGDSEANDLSVVKRLDHVVFGREVGTIGKLTPYDPSLGAVSAQPDEGAMGSMGGDEFQSEEEFDASGEDFADMFGGGRDGPGGGAPGGTGSFAGFPPYHKRYVDINFEQLEGKTVKDAITAVELPPSNLELVVSKRVPVRIALRMKESKIAEFMAACANSPFAFEIKQVRWNKHTPGEVIVASGGGEEDGRAGGFDMDVGGGFGGAGAALSSTPTEIRTSYDVNVEFYGVVKIYNPVREEFLKKAAGLEEEAEADDSAKP